MAVDRDYIQTAASDKFEKKGKLLNRHIASDRDTAIVVVDIGTVEKDYKEILSAGMIGNSSE